MILCRPSRLFGCNVYSELKSTIMTRSEDSCDIFSPNFRENLIFFCIEKNKRRCRFRKIKLYKNLYRIVRGISKEGFTKRHTETGGL